MKKFVLALAIAGLMGVTAAVPAYACEGGKCTMEHAKKDEKKSRKGKKAAKEESCHMTAASTEKTSEAPKSCCMKKDATKAEAAKETKTSKAQQ